MQYMSKVKCEFYLSEYKWTCRHVSFFSLFNAITLFLIFMENHCRHILNQQKILSLESSEKEAQLSRMMSKLSEMLVFILKVITMQ
jgi:hypothetical protein